MRWNCVPCPTGGHFVLLALVVCCLSGSPAQAIVIRDDVDDALYTAKAAEKPYEATGILQGSGIVCTGVLIHPEWVLTAAHCIPTGSSGSTNFQFSLGRATTDLDLTVTADFWIEHPAYDGGDLGEGTDFGLVHLSQPILDVTPARLYRGSSEQYKDATILGYGKTGTGLTGGTGSSGVKRAAQNHVDKLGNASGWTTKTLLTDFDNPNSSSDNHYGSRTPLALEGAVDSGDSGGPWFQTIDGINYLTAITSFKFAFDSSTNADYGDGSAGSRVGRELTWLDANHDLSRFWLGGSSSWNSDSKWTKSAQPGSADAAVIPSGLVTIDSVGATAQYVFVEEGGTLALGESLTTSYLVLRDGAQLDLITSSSEVMVDGNLRQTGGTISLDLMGGTSGPEYGSLTVTGTAELSGTLAIASDAATYADPTVRGDFDGFQLLTATTLSGEFDQVDYDGQSLSVGPNYMGFNDEQADGLFRTLTYEDGMVAVTNYLAIEGDINGDMRVDGLDFNIWNANRFLTNTDWAHGDLNGDGVTDGLDFHVWNQHRFTSVPNSPFDVTFVAVPEPMAVSTGLLAGLLALLACRRRHR